MSESMLSAAVHFWIAPRGDISMSQQPCTHNCYCPTTHLVLIYFKVHISVCYAYYAIR